MANRTKSLEQKQARGTLRKNRIPDNPIVGKLLQGVPPLPKRFTISNKVEDLEDEWARMCEVMIGEKRLYSSDLLLLEMYMDSFLISLVAAETIISKINDNTFIEECTASKTGDTYEKHTKWHHTLNKEAETRRKILNDLCFTPATRSKHGIAKTGESENPAEVLLNNLLHGRSSN